MPVPSAVVDLLVALAPVLVRWGRWYVFGAQAVIVYGVPRLSADVDVTLALDPDAPEQFAREMADAGFVLRVQDPDFVRRTRVMPFVHARTGIPLDVVLAGSGLEEEFLDRAASIDIGGAMIPLIDRGDLIIAKVLAGRPKDLDDARAIWRLHGAAIDAARNPVHFAGARGGAESERSGARLRRDRRRVMTAPRYVMVSVIEVIRTVMLPAGRGVILPALYEWIEGVWLRRSGSAR